MNIDRYTRKAQEALQRSQTLAARHQNEPPGHADGYSYFFRVMGCPQQWSSPCPARVTMNSEPHLAQVYLFPT